MPVFKDYKAIKAIDEELYLLIRFVHTEWDDIELQKDTRFFLMGLYGELMSNIYPPVHSLLLNLKLENDYFYEEEE